MHASRSDVYHRISEFGHFANIADMHKLGTVMQEDTVDHVFELLPISSRISRDRLLKVTKEMVDIIDWYIYVVLFLYKFWKF